VLVVDVLDESMLDATANQLYEAQVLAEKLVFFFAEDALAG
jgi:hypothetical protein